MFKIFIHLIILSLMIKLVSLAWYNPVDWYYGYYGEACSFQGNREVLSSKFNDSLFGQPFVVKMFSVLDNFLNGNHQKALVLSFHGPPGVGKNFVTRIIVETLLTKGLRSSHYHYFTSLRDFPDASKVDSYKTSLKEWVEGNVTDCGKQVFVFDEVEKMPPGIFDVLKPYWDDNAFINKVSYDQTMFILLSNIGGAQISSITYDLWKKGTPREDFHFNDFEPELKKHAINNGGLTHSHAILSHVIDLFVPFLPLEKIHVKKCIKKEAELMNFDIHDETIMRILDEMIFGGPEDQQIYSLTGCKTVRTKVAVQHYVQNSDKKFSDEL